LRHQGKALNEHAGFAFAVLACALWSTWSTRQSGVAWVRRPAALLLVLIGLQITWGIGTFIVKFGVGNEAGGSGVFGLISLLAAQFGVRAYVPQQDSLLQVSIRTGHVLLGMLVWMVSVVYTLRVWRLDSLRANHEQPLAASLSLPNRVSLPGGIG
jgi:cytochrome c oxidase assembly protein subunit 15